jgi:hypothetical protein
MFFHVSKGKAGNIRKADKDEITTNTDKARLRLGKQLFDCKEYDDIGTFDSKTDEWIKARAIDVDTGFRGVYVLPVGLRQDVETFMQERAERRAGLVDQFMAVYDDQRERGRATLNGMFRDYDYPVASATRAKFTMTWQYLEFGVSKNLPPEEYAKAVAAMEQRFATMETECRLTLRETCAELCQHLADTLTPAADGTKKRFFTSSVTNLVEFLDLFAKRDITNDTEMRDLAAKAKAIVSIATPDRLRDDDGMRAQVKTAMEKVRANITTMIETEKRRKFDL